MIVLEGWDASGKGGIIRRMVAEWDPRYFAVWPISAPTEEECDRHFLWPLWQKLPGSQDLNVFDRIWYGRVLVDRDENLCSYAELRRPYDQLHAFTAQKFDSPEERRVGKEM